jgi:hypothetical protein
MLFELDSQASRFPSGHLVASRLDHEHAAEAAERFSCSRRPTLASGTSPTALHPQGPLSMHQEDMIHSSKLYGQTPAT